MTPDQTSADSDAQPALDEPFTSGGLKHESAERIFRLLQFLIANESTRKDVFEHLSSYYKIDHATSTEPLISRRADRMFERDIKFLEDQGYEIKKVKKRAHPTRYIAQNSPDSHTESQAWAPLATVSWQSVFPLSYDACHPDQPARRHQQGNPQQRCRLAIERHGYGDDAERDDRSRHREKDAERHAGCDNAGQEPYAGNE